MSRRPFKPPPGCMTAAQYAKKRGVTTSALSHERKTKGGPPWFWWNAETKRRVLYNEAHVQRWVDNKPNQGPGAMAPDPAVRPRRR